MAAFITKPCEDCGTPVLDRDIPCPVWICYHCHCIRTGRDTKAALNSLVEMIKTGALIYVEPPAPNRQVS